MHSKFANPQYYIKKRVIMLYILEVPVVIIEEMDTTTRVQILDETDFSALALAKGMNLLWVLARLCSSALVRQLV